MPRSGSLTSSKRKQTNARPNTVVAYPRMSDKKQTNSISAQKNRMQKFADERELQIAEFFPEKATSATKTKFLKRTAVKKMLSYMKRHKISTMLVLRADRIFRSNADLILSMIELEKEGVFLRFIEPDIDYSDPFARIMIRQMVEMAELEGKLRGARQDDVYDDFRENRIARVANAISYGWEDAGESDTVCKSSVIAGSEPRMKRKVSPLPAEQAVLKHLMALYEEDNSHGVWSRLSRSMNSLGVPTKTGKDTWYPATVQSVLEHAIIAEDDEIPGGPISLTQAVRILTEPAAAIDAA